MPPYIQKVHNNSTKPVHVNTISGGEGWDIAYGETKDINDYITSDVYSEINVEDGDNSKGYRLRYSWPSQIISLNDNIGLSAGVADSEILSWKDKIYIGIHVYVNSVQIHAKNDYLGLRQADESVKYYYSITATIKEGGGVTLEGFEPQGGKTKDEVEKEEEASAEDGATQSTSKIN